ncbi:MAG: glycosyltransferase, partial [Burkholderiales bacterium]
HEHNALVIEKDNEQGVIEAINRLKSDKKYLARLKNNAINTADAWSDWEIASHNFNQVLLEINRGSPVNREMIISLTNQFNKWVSLAQENLRNQEELKIKLENILNSYSWKVTAPLRYILYKMRKICSIAKSLAS